MARIATVCAMFAKNDAFRTYLGIHKDNCYFIKAIDELHIIEVQIGDELIEEDIERFEWDWNDWSL